MKNFARIAALAAAPLALGVLLAACIFDDDKKLQSSQHSFIGELADLERILDTNVRGPRWRLRVDLDDEPVLRGTCNYAGYLGDSAGVHADDPTGLYTNTSMGGSRKAAEYRADGVILSMDSDDQMDTLTHYRADFGCQY